MKRVILIMLIFLSILIASCSSKNSIVHYRPKQWSEIKISFNYPKIWKLHISNSSIVLYMGIPYSSSIPDDKVGEILIRRWGKTDDNNTFLKNTKEQITKKEVTRIENDYTFELVTINDHPAYKLKFKIYPENYPGVVWEIIDIEDYFILINQEIYEVILRIPEQNYNDPAVKTFYNFLESIDSGN